MWQDLGAQSPFQSPFSIHPLDSCGNVLYQTKSHGPLSFICPGLGKAAWKHIKAKAKGVINTQQQRGFTAALNLCIALWHSLTPSWLSFITWITLTITCFDLNSPSLPQQAQPNFYTHKKCMLSQTLMHRTSLELKKMGWIIAPHSIFPILLSYACW